MAASKHSSLSQDNSEEHGQGTELENSNIRQTEKQFPKYWMNGSQHLAECLASESFLDSSLQWTNEGASTSKHGTEEPELNLKQSRVENWEFSDISKDTYMGKSDPQC